MSQCLVTLPWATRHITARRAWRMVQVLALVRTVLRPVGRNLYLPLSPHPGQSLVSMPWLSSCGSPTWPFCLSLLELYLELGVTGKGLSAAPYLVWQICFVFVLKLILLVAVVLCVYRRRTIMSEYGPILESNNPLSLNSDNSEQGIIMHDFKSNCVICLSYHWLNCI